ncbi:MAG: hypothetical protein LBQ60_10855 [Bacteroidales bacterium]|jgi:hypothetical protein|nr:hypothetical protein [Bacteroidales bacterium]
MLRFFRSSKTIVLIVILLLGGLTWIYTLLEGKLVNENRYGTFLFQSIDGWMDNQPELSVWCGWILSMLGALMLIFVNNRLHLIDRISYMPALCYILLVGGVPSIHQLNPVIIATIFLILAFIQLIMSYRSENLSYGYFLAPLFISVATFFYQYAYVFMVIVWFSILFLRPGYWREWVFSLIGFIFPFFLLFCWYYLLEDNYTAIFIFLEDIFSIHRNIPELLPSTMIFFGVCTVVGIITFGHLMRYIGSRKIIIRNGYYTLIAISIVILIMVAIIPDTLPLAWYLLAFPLSFFLSHYLVNVRSLRWGNILLWLLFAGVLTAQLIYLN